MYFTLYIFYYMAIRNETTDSLINSKITNQQITDIKKPEKNDSKNDLNDSLDDAKNLKKSKDSKKPSFLSTILDELKKVEWPDKNYVLRWSVIIVGFTIFFSISLGFIDHFYESATKFVDCTSPAGKDRFFEGEENNRKLSTQCFSEFAQNLAGQKTNEIKEDSNS